MTNIKTAKLLEYIPRGTTYLITQHNVQIKTGNDWLEGCIYQDTDTYAVYARPYCMFKCCNWGDKIV